MQPEGRLCSKIIREVVAKFPCSMLEKVHGSPYGVVTLDLRGSVNGHAVEIEVKMPGKKPSKRQEKRIELLKAHNVITGWCDNEFDAIRIIEEGLRSKTCD